MASRGRLERGLAVLLAAMYGAAWAAPPCAAPAQAMARVELLFGASVDGATPVSEDAWRRFVDEEVTPRFPEGLTEFVGQGQWRRPDGSVGREASRVLLMWYTPGAGRGQDIEAIRAAYKTRFRQLSVLRVDGMDCVSF